MPRFFLHQRNATEFLEDLEGAEFRDIEGAVEEAVQSARQSMADRVRGGIEPDGWRFEITDSRSVILAVVPFRETMSADGSLDERRPRWIRIDAV